MRPYFFLILIATFGCPLLAQERAADLIIVNAAVRTMDETRPAAEAVAVRGGRITAVGTNADVRKLAGPATRVVDAGGRLVLPGFNDAHVHFMAIGNLFSTLDLKGISKSEDTYSELRRYARFLPAGRWIIGSGASVELLESLDAAAVADAAPGSPVLLYAAGGEAGFANDAAIAAGRLGPMKAGVLRGNALEIVRRAVPADHSRRWAEVAETATNYAASLGVTSVADTHSDDMTAVYRELERGGKLKTRIYDCIGLSEWSREKKARAEETPEQMVRTGCLKSFTEGEDDWTPVLMNDASAADKAAWQVAVHAIGERPNAIAADVAVEVIRRNGRRDRRFRIEHAERAGAETVRRFLSVGTVASVQPFLFGSTGGRYYRMLADAGVPLAVGSDAPMTAFDPMKTVHAAVGRGGLTVEAAVRAYTAGSAFAEFADGVKGTIAPGKLADIVILSQNIFEIDTVRIPETRAVCTIVDGRVVYSSL